MTEFGFFPNTESVRFERSLPGPIDRVWSYLTEAEALSTWFARGRIEPRLGGRITLAFPNEKGGAKIQGIVRRFEPPRALAYTWILGLPNGASQESLAAFDMEPEDARVKLVLTHQSIAAGFRPHTAAGWHALLDELEAQLDGVAPEPFIEIVRRVYPVYAGADRSMQ